MQKLRPSPSTYTIHAPLSIRRSHQSNYQEQSSTSASTELYSPRSNIMKQVLPHKPIQEYGQEPSDLNTSGGNSTIYECVKMLEAHDRSLSLDNISRSPTSDETKMDPTRKFSTKDLRIVCQEDYGQVLALKDPRSRKDNPNVSETVREFAELMKAKNPQKDEKEKFLRMSQETTDLNTRSSHDKDTKDTIPLLKYQIISPKSSTKNSILKSHTPLFNGSKPPSTSSSIHQTTRRRLRDESSTFKESQSATQRSRIGTSPPLTDRENRENISQQPNIHHQSAKALYSQVTSPQSQKYHHPSVRTSEATPTQNKIIPRRDSCPQKQLLQNPVPPLNLNLNLNQNTKPMAITLSRSVQALATPRGEYSIKNNENLKTIESARSPNTKSTKKIEHNKIKKEMHQEPRAARIDLVGTDLMTKCLQQKKESKVSEKIDQIDKIYTKLRKSLMDKKDDLSNNDKVLKMLDTLKNDMVMIQNSINNDWKSK